MMRFLLAFSCRGFQIWVVIFQHQCPFKVWVTFAGPGIDARWEIVQTRRIVALFIGHTHYGQVANDGRNIPLATRSIGDPEGVPPGYTVAFVQGNDLAIIYRCVADPSPIVLVTHPRDTLLATRPEHVAAGDDCCRVRA
jgi:3',5'-cyclic-AMP phosphodiesterase